MEQLLIGFKGERNASGVIVNSINAERCLLTNSFVGLKKDIDSIHKSYDLVYMFGIDKNLKSHIRIEAFAKKDGNKISSQLDLEKLSQQMNDSGILNVISYTATHYLCNEAYWYALKKFHQNVVFIHIPPLRYIDDLFIKKVKQGLLG